jgi:hypothetical protein
MKPGRILHFRYHFQALNRVAPRPLSNRGWDTASTTHNFSLPAWLDVPANVPTKAVMDQLRAAIPLL